MNEIDKTLIEVREAVEIRDQTSAWLRAFESALAGGDEAGLADLFTRDGNWRDILAFTWHLKPVVGAGAIAQGLLARQPAVGARSFAIAAGRTAPRRVKRMGRDCIEAIYSFEANAGRCAGLIRLVPATDGAAAAGLKATVISLSLIHI